MRKKITILAILIASMFIGLPVDGSAMTKATSSVTNGVPGPQISVRIGTQRRRYRRGGYWRNGRWYRNYGQYRRTVGGRRYRLVPRYYWDDGIRRVRYVRVYYW